MHELGAGERLLASPLEVLFERAELPRWSLPIELTRSYGGDLGFDSPRVFANFVSSIDGVVALPGAGESGQVISQNSAADRFVMALLRTAADAVLLGAGTFRKSPRHLWYPEAIYPAGARVFTEARARLGLAPSPRLFLVTASGTLDLAEPALNSACILTTDAGARVLRGHVPATARVEVVGKSRVAMSDVIALLRAEGYRRILTEGGPSLVAELVKERLLDELFLTLSPALYGRFASDERKAVTHGLDLGETRLALLSLRRDGSHLFLRYALNA